jgi:hypothetical protein
MTDLQNEEVSKLAQTINNLPNAASGNVGLDPNSLVVVTPAQIQQFQKMLEFGTFSTGILGVGFMAYGLLSRAKKRDWFQILLLRPSIDWQKARLHKKNF